MSLRTRFFRVERTIRRISSEVNFLAVGGTSAESPRRLTRNRTIVAGSSARREREIFARQVGSHLWLLTLLLRVLTIRC